MTATCRSRHQPLDLSQRRRVVCAWAAVCLALLPGFLRAGTGAVWRVPVNGKPQHGIQLVVDTRWVDAHGYRPVRIEAICAGNRATAVERNLQIVLQSDYPWGSCIYTTTGFLQVPAGAVSAATTLSVPQFDRWYSIVMDVYENGEKLDDLTATISDPTRAVGEWSEAYPAILVIDDDAPSLDERQGLLQRRQLGSAVSKEAPRLLPDIRVLGKVFEPRVLGSEEAASEAETTIDDVGTLAFSENLMRVEILPPETLPAKWIDYTCFDFIFVSWLDLKKLAGDNPEAWRAIGDWLKSGPTLCVYGMELTAEEIGELESLVGCLPDETEDETRDPTTGWRKPQLENAIGLIRASHPASFMQDTVDDKEIAANTAAKPPTSPPFLYRSAGLGRLVAMAGEEPFSAGPYGFSWLLNELNSRTWMWYLRHGMSLRRDNVDYWNWAVPGIGRAPVGVFLISITAFILVIGPLNYLLLRRYQRLYLLPVTVSGGAGLISLALVSFALLGDGLSVRVRVRSFTWLDQRASRAVSWSRQSYYAGLAPSRGLEFPEDAAVYPLARYPARSLRPGRSNPQLVWSHGQLLRSGFLASRSTAQLLVIQSGSSRVRLAIDDSPHTTAGPRVVNELGVHIDQLLMKDDQGRCFQASEVEPNQSCTPAATALAPATQRLQAALRAHQPTLPPGYRPQAYSGYGNYSYFNALDFEQTPPSCGTGVLERSIAQALAAAETLPPRSYVALTRTAPTVPLGHDRVQEQASFHVVFGRW